MENFFKFLEWRRKHLYGRYFCGDIIKKEEYYHFLVKHPAEFTRCAQGRFFIRLSQ